MLHRSADDAEVALLMKDFDEGDRMLKIVSIVPPIVEVIKSSHSLIDNRGRKSISHSLDRACPERIGHGN